MEELKDIANNEIFDAGFRRKKMISWLIRTIIAIVLYIIFWDYEWVRWSLWIYVPLNLFGLVMLFIVPRYLKKKHEKLEKKMNEL